MKTLVFKILSDDGIMLILGCIITIIAVIIAGILLKNKTQNIDLLEKNNKRSEQNKKNVEFIFGLLEGNYLEIMAPDRLRFTKSYSEWQELENKMSDEASPETIKKINQLMKKRSRHDFYFFQAGISNNLPEGEKELILKDVFTEPFPSLHDMDDWAICEKATVVLTLKRINFEESKKYFIHIKQHFVNHNLVAGIMMFDVYKIA